VRLSPDVRAAGPWWQAFGSPELDGAIRQALADSPTIAAARATLERSQAQARAIRGAQFAQVDANAAAQNERINLAAFGFSGFPGLPPLSNPTINLYQIGGSVSYDLDLFGGKKRATEQANALADSAARQADAAYLTLSGNMATQAMQIASLRGQIAAVQGIIADDRRIIDMVRSPAASPSSPRTRRCCRPCSATSTPRATRWRCSRASRRPSGPRRTSISPSSRRRPRSPSGCRRN
jgi:outer membrane protein TolC